MASRAERSDLTLVLGGARSGKSLFAERLAARYGTRVLYVATAECLDDEMIERVRLHRERRPTTWRTVETPLDPVSALSDSAGACDVVLLDCLSLWVNNILVHSIPERESTSRDIGREAEIVVDGAVRELIAWQHQARVPLIIVSAETGLGIVPEHALARLYRDLLGRANQRLAEQANRVYLVVSGLGLDLKALGASPVPPER